jgi:hypothetical protein
MSWSVTDTAVVNENVLDVAEIVANPTLPPRVTFPLALTLATAVSEDDHVSPLLMSCVLPSVHTPVADSCAVDGDPVSDSAGPEGVTYAVASPTTVTVLLPVMPPLFAEIVAVPAPTGVPTPPALTVATLAADDDQLADVVRSFVDPSE